MEDDKNLMNNFRWKLDWKLEIDGVRSVLKVSQLNKSVKEQAYQEILSLKYEVLRDGDVKNVEKEWEELRDIMKMWTNDVCSMGRVCVWGGGQEMKWEE